MASKKWLKPEEQDVCMLEIIKVGDQLNRNCIGDITTELIQGYKGALKDPCCVVYCFPLITDPPKPATSTILLNLYS